MSSAIGSKQTAQNGVMKEGSERGCSILAALSNNSSRPTKIYDQGLSLSEYDAIPESTSSEHYLSHETPPWLNSTHQCHQSRAGLQEANEVMRSPLSSRRELDLAAEETKESLKDYDSSNILPLAEYETRSSDLTSNYSVQGQTVDESEGLVETEDLGLRKPPLKSILKKQGVHLTLDFQSISHDASNHQAIFTEVEMASKSKMADHDTDSKRGLVVFIPTSKHAKMSRKHILQLAAMSGCGFVLVALIVAWVFSPIFLQH